MAGLLARASRRTAVEEARFFKADNQNRQMRTHFRFGQPDTSARGQYELRYQAILPWEGESSLDVLATRLSFWVYV
jgi:hypothetical protein